MLLFIDPKNKKLKKVWLGKNETKISLKHKKIETIGNRVFENNKNIKEVIFPDTVKQIETASFMGCSNLEKVTLPEGIIDIGFNAFGFCKSLKEIDLPDSIEYLGANAFEYCVDLRKVKLSNGIKKIFEYSFQNCKSLEKIVIPEGVQDIRWGVFYDCENLKYVELPSSLERVSHSSFGLCNNLEKIAINDWRIFLNKNNEIINEELQNNLKYVYVNQDTNELIISKNEEHLDNYKELYLSDCNYHFSDNPIINWQLSIIYVCLFKDMIGDSKMEKILSEYFTHDLNKDNYALIKKDINNNDKFIKLLKQIDKTVYNKKRNFKRFYSEYEVFKFAYSLGAFSDNEIERQRACEFIKNIYEKDILDLGLLHYNFESMKINGFNKEWAEFVMKKGNIEKLAQLEKEQTGYIARVYNDFDELREFGRSNRGKQRYRKVTIDMCKEFFYNATFVGVNYANADISETIKSYTHRQESFDKAAQIRKQYSKLKKEKKVSDHLLNEELKEIRKEIVENTGATFTRLNEISKNKFTYEFLCKYDPENFVLGKLCSCCAHLEGVGEGIMIASILHPDCQNLVIRDERGKIIAKSTLYINRVQGYGVFNNVEINTEVVSTEDKEKIYKKFIKAVNDFANRYNELNKNNPLKIINVGMNMNNLNYVIRRYNKKSNNILEGINFSNYGGYDGDWQKEQYVVWENKKK